MELLSISIILFAVAGMCIYLAMRYLKKYGYSQSYELSKVGCYSDSKAIVWAAEYLGMEMNALTSLLQNVCNMYDNFSMPKRKGGFRTISAPKPLLLKAQRTIYTKVLREQTMHSAATGFCLEKSIVDNARAHLGNKMVLKMDLHDFFGTIRRPRVVKTFELLGFPKEKAQILAFVCCYKEKLPQGAPTSPALSNIVAHNLDKELEKLAAYYKLTYTRYADDLTFSGEEINMDIFLPKVIEKIEKEKFVVNRKKTQLLAATNRKIVTGVSISSLEKMTIPKRKKRELRKNIHYILTRGLEAHKQHIKSTDPGYLKRLIGYLNFWRMVEPENQYVLKSIEALRKIES